MGLTYVKPVQRCDNSNIESNGDYVDWWTELIEANWKPDQSIPGYYLSVS
jgi:hypothetical protein